MQGFSEKYPVVLLRGAPGSGKSTLARSMFAGHKHLEADMFFQTPDGYRFDPTQLKTAHAWCLGLFKIAVTQGIPVVVSNTFTRLWEIRPYLDFAPDALVVHCRGDFGNVHGVPDAKVQEMCSRYEPLDGEAQVFTEATVHRNAP
jgi:energy-coupling factor transporter ATP-binding protein EcfA2